MKARMLNGQVRKSAGKIRQTSSGEGSHPTAMADSERMARLLELTQEMGGPLNVVIGRMEYLLGRNNIDGEVARSLNAIFSQAQRLVKLRQQLLGEAHIAPSVADSGLPGFDRERAT